jgi:hypothetical protein
MAEITEMLAAVFKFGIVSAVAVGTLFFGIWVMATLWQWVEDRRNG